MKLKHEVPGHKRHNAKRNKGKAESLKAVTREEVSKIKPVEKSLSRIHTNDYDRHEKREINRMEFTGCAKQFLQLPFIGNSLSSI